MSDAPILGSTSHRVRLKATLGSFVGGLLCLAGGVGALAGYGYLEYNAADTLLTDAEVWESGTVALDAGIEGEVTTRQIIFDSYNLNVDWLDASGAFHETEVEFDTLFGSVDDNEPVEVRYLARGGGYVVATSWGESVRGYRWTAVAFMTIIGFLIGGGFVWLGKVIIDKALQTAKTVKECREVLLRVVSVGSTNNNGVVQDTYLLHDDETNKDHTQVFTKGRRPFFVGAAGTHVLALRPVNGDFTLVLREDLYPLAKDMSATADAKARAAAHSIP